MRPATPGTIEPWSIEHKPFTSAGHTAVIRGGRSNIKIMPSTMSNHDQVDALAKRIAAIPVYEAVLQQLGQAEDPAVAMVALSALKKGGW